MLSVNVSWQGQQVGVKIKPGEGGVWVWTSREEGQRGESKTKGVAKGVKTAVGASVAVVDSVKLEGI